MRAVELWRMFAPHFANQLYKVKILIEKVRHPNVWDRDIQVNTVENYPTFA
jgi:hypothetical protein